MILFKGKINIFSAPCNLKRETERERNEQTKLCANNKLAPTQALPLNENNF